MTPKGKKELIKSLTPIIDQWMNDQELNTVDANQIGYVSEDDELATLMASAAVMILEANFNSQKYVEDHSFESRRDVRSLWRG